MAIKVRSNNNWIIPSTYIRVGGVWVLSSNYVRYLGDWAVIHILAANNNTAANQNINVQTLFESVYPGSWFSGISKRLIIDPGAIVGATDTSNYALNIPSAFSGSVKIDNYGSILGAGGVGSSVNGGNAIFAGAAGITINNQGTIYAGGGSGGSGGTGGAGSYTTQGGGNYSGIRAVTPVYIGNIYFSGITAAQALAGCSSACKSAYGSNWYAATPCGYGAIGGDYCYPVCKYGITCTAGGRGQPSTCYLTSSESWTCVYDINVASAGGVGGNGGRGQGYNQSAAGGAGGFDGGTNAGGGGPGGTGGAFGASGGNGFVGANGNAGTAPVLGAAGGPGYGGLAGYYIVNNGNVTWTTTGTRLGRVG